MVNWVGTCRKTCSGEAHELDILLVGGIRHLWADMMDLADLQGGKTWPRDRKLPFAPWRSEEARKLRVLGDNDEARVLSYELGCEYSHEGRNDCVGCWSNKREDQS